MSETTYTGGCLCGAVRFKSTAAPLWAGHCHCGMCRRSSGADYQSWVGFPLDSFAYIRGEPRFYPSSEGARRGFCPHCGSQMAFETGRYPTTAIVTRGVLDDPAAVTPKAHIHWNSHMPNVGPLEAIDGLPRRPD